MGEGGRRERTGRRVRSGCGLAAADARFEREDRGENREEGESAAPGKALGVQGEMGFDEGRIGAERQQRGEVREGVEAVGDLAGFQARPPDLQQRAGGGEHEKRQADGDAQDGEDGEDGVGGAIASEEGANDPEDARGCEPARAMWIRCTTGVRRESQCA